MYILFLFNFFTIFFLKKVNSGYRRNDPNKSILLFNLDISSLLFTENLTHYKERPDIIKYHQSSFKTSQYDRLIYITKIIYIVISYSLSTFAFFLSEYLKHLYRQVSAS